MQVSRQKGRIVNHLVALVSGPGVLSEERLRSAPTNVCSRALEEAAQYHTANPEAAGCLVLEGIRCNDRDARAAALAYNIAAEGVIRDYLASRCSEQAEQLTDFVSTIMSGLSAKSRNGHDVDQLLTTVRLARLAIAQTVLTHAPIGSGTAHGRS